MFLQIHDDKCWMDGVRAHILYIGSQSDIYSGIADPMSDITNTEIP